MHDLPELPVIKDATVGTLRLEGTLDKRLPQMPTGEIPDLDFTDFRKEYAEKAMNDMRAAFAISRQYEQRSKARARAHNRRQQKLAEHR